VIRAISGVLLAATLPVAPLAAQCPDGTPPPCRSARAAARPANANSVAVLYFENTSTDSADAYLVNGLTEEVILRLQQVRRLEVKSRYESQRVRGRRDAAPAVLGRELGARYLVNGTIQRAGERIVVRVELTRADRGVGVWSERYDRTSTDVLGVIDDVARGVATGVAGQLLPAETANLARRPTTDPAAYEHYVRGNVYLARRDPISLARAIQEYEAAWARDSSFKSALGRVAYAYTLGLARSVAGLTGEQVAARADSAVTRARRTAPDVAETWIADGFRELMHSVLGTEDRMEAALTSLRHAVEVDPQNAEAHHQYGQGLAIAGPDSAALTEYRRALALEPGRAVTCEEISRLLYVAGRYRESLAWADSALAADPNLARGIRMQSRVRLALGDVAGAERALATVAAADVDADDAAVHMLILVAKGDTLGARRLAPAVGGRFGIFTSEALVAVGASEELLNRVEPLRSVAVRCWQLRFPVVATLRGTPRYDRLVADCPPR
jgi:TolB-like protein